MEFERRDLKDYDSFEKFGDVFTKIYANDDKHVYVFRREKKCNGTSKVSYEVVKGVKYKKSNGTSVFAYPTSERFANVWVLYRWTGGVLQESNKVQARLFGKVIFFLYLCNRRLVWHENR